MSSLDGGVLGLQFPKPHVVQIASGGGQVKTVAVQDQPVFRVFFGGRNWKMLPILFDVRTEYNVTGKVPSPELI